jgi:hypothetical protein
MKTKSVVKPRDIQRLVLNLDPEVLPACSVEDDMIFLSCATRETGFISPIDPAPEY